MANTVKLRRSATPGAIPTTAQIALGEVAINTYDGKVFLKKDDGTESIVEVGGISYTISSTAPASPDPGDMWFDLDDGIQYAWIDDGNSSQWIETGRAGNVVFSTATSYTYTKAQIGAIVTLTDAATISMDASLGNNFELTLGGNRNFANPTNMSAGQVGSIFITQDGTGGRTLSWGAYWLFPGGTAPTLSTAAGAKDRVDFIIKSATEIQAQFSGNFQ